MPPTGGETTISACKSFGCNSQFRDPLKRVLMVWRKKNKKEQSIKTMVNGEREDSAYDNPYGCGICRRPFWGTLLGMFGTFSYTCFVVLSSGQFSASKTLIVLSLVFFKLLSIDSSKNQIWKSLSMLTSYSTVCARSFGPFWALWDGNCDRGSEPNPRSVSRLPLRCYPYYSFLSWLSVPIYVPPYVGDLSRQIPWLFVSTLVFVITTVVTRVFDLTWGAIPYFLSALRSFGRVRFARRVRLPSASRRTITLVTWCASQTAVGGHLVDVIRGLPLHPLPSGVVGQPLGKWIVLQTSNIAHALPVNCHVFVDSCSCLSHVSQPMALAISVIYTVVFLQLASGKVSFQFHAWLSALHHGVLNLAAKPSAVTGSVKTFIAAVSPMVTVLRFRSLLSGGRRSIKHVRYLMAALEPSQRDVLVSTLKPCRNDFGLDALRRFSSHN